MSEQPGRYQRSTSGLVAAILITLAAIGGFVAVRGLVRDDVTQEPEAVDYLETVGLAQEAGVELVYPRSIPEDWLATSVDLVPGQRPAWSVGMLTGAGRFVGVHSEDASLADLLATYVDPDEDEITELPEEEIPSEVADTWRSFEDEGGDRAYAAESGDLVVLVYGSAPAEDLRTVVAALTDAPLDDAAGS